MLGSPVARGVERQDIKSREPQAKVWDGGDRSGHFTKYKWFEELKGWRGKAFVGRHVHWPIERDRFHHAQERIVTLYWSPGALVTCHDVCSTLACTTKRGIDITTGCGVERMWTTPLRDPREDIIQHLFLSVSARGYTGRGSRAHRRNRISPHMKSSADFA